MKNVYWQQPASQLSEKRDEYIQESVDYCFVLTDDSWKAVEFLNQQNSEGAIYFF